MKKDCHSIIDFMLMIDRLHGFTENQINILKSITKQSFDAGFEKGKRTLLTGENKNV